MVKKLIGVTGLQGSGKDTTADYIVSHYDNWEKWSFAGILKDVSAILFGWDRKMLAGETPEDRKIREEKDEYWSEVLGYDITPRKALQILGTNVLRAHFFDGIWVEALRKKLISTDKNIIISDTRFGNEIEMIKKLGGEIWRVERDIPEWFNKCSELNQKGYNSAGMCNLIPELTNVHISEWNWIGIDKPNLILKVNGEFDFLYNQIKTYMESK